MFRRSQKLDIGPVSFNGSAPAIQSALGCHTPIAFTVITPAVPQVKEDKLRALAVTTPKRSPEVPTLAEAGVRDQEADTILGVLVPVGTPQPIIALLHRKISNAITQLNTEGGLVGLGFDPIVNTPEEYAARIRVDIQKWADVLRAANIRPE